MKYGHGCIMSHGKQVRAVVQAKTKKRMAELVEDNIGHFSNYWHVDKGFKEHFGEVEGLWVGPDTNYNTEEKDFKKIK